MMTMKQAKEALKKIRVTIRKRDGEYRVNLAEGNEDTAYYTDDLKDAVDTGIMMRHHANQNHA